MTTALATPQQMRERLLQATDGQSNAELQMLTVRQSMYWVYISTPVTYNLHRQIKNMVAVLDVISKLEKYPITKEALEETRLGKLINDIRKKTRDEDLARRAKKLLRNWQKLIEPQQNEKCPKEPSSTFGFSQTPPLSAAKSVQIVTDTDRTSFRSSYSLSLEKAHPLNCKREQKGEEKQPAKVLKSSTCGQIAALPASRHKGCLEAFSSVVHPTNTCAIKPLPISCELGKQSNASSLLRTPVLQQYGQKDGPLTERVQSKPQSHRPARQLEEIKQPVLVAGSKSESFSSVKKNLHTESLPPKAILPPWENDPLQNNERALEQTNNSQNMTRGLQRHQPGLLSEVTNVETEKDTKLSEGKRRKYHSRDYTDSSDGHLTEDKPIRVKNRKLTFDPITQQIRPLAVNQNEGQHSPMEVVNESDSTKQILCTSPTTLHKTNWRELSQNNIVKHYLNLQSNLLKTSGSQTGSHCLMTEYLNHEEDHVRESSKTYLMVPSVSEMDLPGTDQGIKINDMDRIHNMHWPGVNGCYDNRGNWYDWTKCISLDPYGDGSKLDILPYVCID